MTPHFHFLAHSTMRVSILNTQHIRSVGRWVVVQLLLFSRILFSFYFYITEQFIVERTYDTNTYSFDASLKQSIAIILIIVTIIRLSQHIVKFFFFLNSGYTEIVSKSIQIFSIFDLFENHLIAFLFSCNQLIIISPALVSRNKNSKILFLCNITKFSFDIRIIGCYVSNSLWLLQLFFLEILSEFIVNAVTAFNSL